MESLSQTRSGISAGFRPTQALPPHFFCDTIDAISSLHNMNRQTSFGIELPALSAISLVIVVALACTGTAQKPPSPLINDKGVFLLLPGARHSGNPTPDFQETRVPDKITIGTIVPTSASLAEMGQATKAVIDAAFAEANLKGGINHHQLELKVIEIGDK